jgi:hypothetical protein
MLDLADHYSDLHNFYTSQKSTWDKLRKAQQDFQLNRQKLEKDIDAARALTRMDAILDARAPYSLLREADALIQLVSKINDAELEKARERAALWVQKQIDKVSVELQALQASPDQSNRSLLPLQSQLKKLASQRSIAHIAQLQDEARDFADEAIDALHELAEHMTALAKEAEQNTISHVDNNSVQPVENAAAPYAPAVQAVVPPATPVKKRRVINPQQLVGSGYLETQEDIENFLIKLRKELEQALANNERVEIR